MKTSQYFRDDAPLQILLLDDNLSDGRDFFDNGLGSTWVDYELHMIDQPSDAEPFLDTTLPNRRGIDLLLISNSIWFKGGEELVTQLRSHSALARLPVYCIVTCQKKEETSDLECWDKDWRKTTDCDENSAIAEIPFAHYLAYNHPARLDGTICANNIGAIIPQLINNMAAYWFQSTGSA